MRIISDFKDYYDTAMGYGVDYDSLWLRKKEKLSREQGLSDIAAACGSSMGSIWSRLNLDVDHKGYAIGFCGKVYGCVLLKIKGYDRESCSTKLIAKKFCYSLDEVDLFADTHFKKKHLKHYYSKTDDWGWRFRNSGITCNRKGFKIFFDRCKKQEDLHEKKFIDANSPIIINNTKNAKLKNYEFYKVVDPYTAFQEIQMFFGKLRSPEKPIPKISDEDMLQAKGFDPKWSFRKEPGTKKRKRKKK